MPEPPPETLRQRRILVAPRGGSRRLVLAVLALALGVGLLVDRTSTQVGFVWAEIGLAVLGAVGPGPDRAGPADGRRWAQGGLAITLQLIGLPFGGRLAQFGYW